MKDFTKARLSVALVATSLKKQVISKNIAAHSNGGRVNYTSLTMSSANPPLINEAKAHINPIPYGDVKHAVCSGAS